MYSHVSKVVVDSVLSVTYEQGPKKQLTVRNVPILFFFLGEINTGGVIYLAVYKGSASNTVFHRPWGKIQSIRWCLTGDFLRDK